MAKNLYVGVGGVARRTKAIYVGVPTVTLTNLAPAINGTEGWEATSGTLAADTSIKKYSANSLRLYGGTSLAEAHIATTEGIPILANHKYYIRNEVYFSGATYRRTSCYWPIAEPNVYNSNSLGISIAANTWTTLAVVSNRTSAGHSAGTYPYRIDFDSNYAGGYMYVDGIMVIDLTACFGSGNEPDQAWCNANIPYFTGSMEMIYNGATSKARKVLKAYIGVNGVARLFYVGATLESIAVTTMPTKTIYTVGETFDSTGMVVTATYSDGSTKEVDCSFVYDFQSAGTKTVTATYSENGVIAQTTFDVTVKAETVPVTITGSGGTNMYITVDDANYTSATTLEVEPGDAITLFVCSQRMASAIIVDGVTVKSCTSSSVASLLTYDLTVEEAMTSIEIALDYTYTSSRIFGGTITVTTS